MARASKASSSSTAVLAAVLIFMTLVSQSYGQLKVGFYDGKCGTTNVEKIIFDIVEVAFNNEKTIVAILLQLQFHDCFVRGCDASILLDGNNTEKIAGLIGSIRGFDLIDAIKERLEQRCPQVVSCADIVAIATRVAVFLAGEVWYDVENGRRDGVISQASEAIANLSPGSTIRVPHAVQVFANNFLTSNKIDNLPSKALEAIVNLSEWSKIPVPRAVQVVEVFSNNVFTSNELSMLLSMYNAVQKDQGGQGGKNLYRMANQFLTLQRTKTIVSRLTTRFGFEFGSAMKKLGRVGVLTGSQGQIRKNCQWVNHNLKR